MTRDIDSPLNPPREVSILSQVPLQGILRAPTDFAAHKAEGTIKKKGKKRVRLVDPRLELTDEELKVLILFITSRLIYSFQFLVPKI